MNTPNLVSLLNDDLPHLSQLARLAPNSVVRGMIARIGANGLIAASCASGLEIDCEIVDSLANVPLAAGDSVIVVLPTDQTGLGVILGRVVRSQVARASADVVIQATQSLRLQCGNSSIELRADGKVLIKGDDVTVRAKGTKRIRAGSVSIN